MPKRYNPHVITDENNTPIGWDHAQKRLLHNGTVSIFITKGEAEAALTEIRAALKVSKSTAKFEIIPYVEPSA